MPKKILAGDTKNTYSRKISNSALTSLNKDKQTKVDDPQVPDERWQQEQQTLRRAAMELAKQRSQREAAAMSHLVAVGERKSLEDITESLEDSSKEVRNAAVRALYSVNPEYAASFFNGVLREGPAERRRRIGAALAGSGLVSEAIQHLKSGRQQNVYGIISLLFLVAKAGEVQPLVSVLEDHPSIELRLALIELLALSGDAAIVPTFRRLALRSSLPSELRTAIMEAIYQISSQSRDGAPV
ncbi:MAG TPA: HEAT repeat domain-containing protein [Pyrinomonadaceae bacterium]|nr:HEAT repeat domain-containing protein [Pyrinomonadaceae bacterium]